MKEPPFLLKDKMFIDVSNLRKFHHLYLFAGKILTFSKFKCHPHPVHPWFYSAKQYFGGFLNASSFIQY